jgi:predicted Zn-dependent protease
MNADNLPLDGDAMRLIAEIGFMGAHSGQHAAARAIFESLLILRPDSTLPFIGFAVTDMAMDLPEDAVRILRDKGLKQHPGDAELMAFLGLALQSGGQSAEAKKVFHALVEQNPSNTEPHVRMAKKALLINKDSVQPIGLIPRWTEPARMAADTAGARPGEPT